MNENDNLKKKKNLKNNLKNILNIKNDNNIFRYDEKKKKWILKDKYKIIKNCNTEKKNKLKNLSRIIKNLSKIPNENTLKQIKDINKKYEEEIQNLDDLIKEVLSDSENDNFIEIYSN